MKIFYKLKNIIRNRLKKSILGRILLNAKSTEKFNSICIVSATRLSERDFWRKSALGQSLQPKLINPMITAQIYYKNSYGLPKIFNTHLKDPDTSDIIIFIHDDVWLDDESWVEKIKLALQKFDIVGVAGNTRISKYQPAWQIIKVGEKKYTWDNGYLSGGVATGQHRKGEIQMYGPTPAPCKLLGGMLLAVSKYRIQKEKVAFDEQFDFNFYDMDFCRTAHKAGLSMGTWPIALTHQSNGTFGTKKWEADSETYFKKWRD